MYIDLTLSNNCNKGKKKKNPIWIPNLKLTMYEKQILLDPVGWMSDKIIDAAQVLLKQQFPHIQSLQDVVLGLTMSFHIQTGEFLQIIHCNNHWFTISSVGVGHDGQPRTVKVFDSMYDSVPNLGKAQIACLLCTSEDLIQVKIMDVQKQVCSSRVCYLILVISLSL